MDLSGTQVAFRNGYLHKLTLLVDFLSNASTSIRSSRSLKTVYYHQHNYKGDITRIHGARTKIDKQQKRIKTRHRWGRDKCSSESVHFYAFSKSARVSFA